MSAWKVIYTQLAERDLRSVYEYIAFSLLEPETARKQMRRILDAVVKLNNLPHRFQRYPNGPWTGKGIRVMPVDNNYLVFYLTAPTQDTVVIIRVMYLGRDVSTLLAQTKAYSDLLEKISEAEDQIKAGNVYDAVDSLKRLREKHGF